MTESTLRKCYLLTGQQSIRQWFEHRARTRRRRAVGPDEWTGRNLPFATGTYWPTAEGHERQLRRCGTSRIRAGHRAASERIDGLVWAGTSSSRHKAAVIGTSTGRAGSYDRFTSDSGHPRFRWVAWFNGRLVTVSVSRAAGGDGPQPLLHSGSKQGGSRHKVARAQATRSGTDRQSTLCSSDLCKAPTPSR